MTENEWRLFRQAISIVEQAWFQLDQLLTPTPTLSARQRVTEALRDLRDALFKAEMDEVSSRRAEQRRDGVNRDRGSRSETEKANDT